MRCDGIGLGLRGLWGGGGRGDAVARICMQHGMKMNDGEVGKWGQQQAACV